MSPKSSSPTLMSRRAVARTVPSSIGTSYVRPVRLSVIVRESAAVATPPPLLVCSSVPMGLPFAVSPSLPANHDGYGPPGDERLALAGDDGAEHRERDQHGGERHDRPGGALAGGERLVAADPDGG